MTKTFDNRGFTLMELLVSIAVFSILTSMVTVSYASNEKHRLLKQESNKILSGLQKAENMSITGQIFDSFSPVFYEFIMEECSNDCYYRIVAVSGDGIHRELEKVPLKGLAVEVAGDKAAVRFFPPRGRMEIVDNGPLIKIGVANDSGDYCLEANSISGRIGLSEGNCN